MQNNYDKLLEKVKGLEKLIHSKVDCEMYDEEINNIKNMIATLS